MAPYIYKKYNRIHLIDIRETIKGLIRAYHFLYNVTKNGELVLFVGTKHQAAGIIESQAKRCGMPYVSQHWVGGTLTNFATIRRRLSRLQQIEQLEQEGKLSEYSKKEIATIMREKRRLSRNLDGIRTMERLPAAVVIIDPLREEISVAESNRIRSAVIALTDTDCDPDPIDIVIPGNDDSVKVIQLVVSKLADAVVEGKGVVVGAEEGPPSTANSSN